MTLLLATESKAERWYEYALADGFGAVRQMPRSIEEADSIAGTLWWFLYKKFPNTFLIVLDDETTSSEIREHTRAMLALFPHSTLLLSKNETDTCTAVEVSNLNIQKLEEIKAAIKEAHSQGKKILVTHISSPDGNPEKIRHDLQDLFACEPDFLATSHIDIAKRLIATDNPYTNRNPFRSKQILKLRAFLGKYRKKLSEWPVYKIIYLYEALTGNLITIHKRPIYASQYTEPPNRFHNFPLCAIVLQGPLQLERSFTLETVRLYKKIFPDTKVIVSTWENEDAETLENIRQSGGVVVTSKLPPKGGWGNINFQITSSAAGVREAAKLGAQYVLKQRSDQRVYNMFVFEMMVAMLDSFPAGPKSNQKKRIIFGNGGPVQVPYWMGEVIFGDIDDMLEYYETPATVGDKSEYFAFLTELYMPSEYLKRKGWKLDWSVAQGIEVYKECFIPLDWWMMDIYWYKYRRWFGYVERSYKYGAPSTTAMNFGQWLSLMQDPTNRIPRPEQRLVLEIVKRNQQAN